MSVVRLLRPKDMWSATHRLSALAPCSLPGAQRSPRPCFGISSAVHASRPIILLGTYCEERSQVQPCAWQLPTHTSRRMSHAASARQSQHKALLTAKCDTRDHLSSHSFPSQRIDY